MGKRIGVIRDREKGGALTRTQCTPLEPHCISLMLSHSPGHRLEHYLAVDSGGLSSPLPETLLRPDGLPTAQILEQLCGPGTEAFR